MIAAHKFGFPVLLLLTALPHLLDAQTALTLLTSLTPSILGVPVTLTAIVRPLTATGRVTFYDGVTLLGDAPLLAGTASISTSLLPSGNRKLKAYYAGDGANAAATSSVVAQTVNARPAIGTFAQGVSLMSYFPAVVADFNGDGKADIAVNPKELNTFVLLGQGDGTFKDTSTAFSPALSIDVIPVAAGDFNGDGKSDLVVLDLFYNELGIVLGNGDGTFQTPFIVIVPTTHPFFPTVAVGDFNGDGKADIAFTGPTAGVTILLGKGDGTFQPPVSYPVSLQAGLGANLVVVGDFNGDGKADLATTTSNSPILSILLGNGDGSFQPSIAVTVPDTPISLLAEDLNKDGKTDLVIGQRDNPVVSILLGKGDGTFQPPVNYAISSVAHGLTVGDFNGDGNADLAVTGLSILLGNGDGTFQLPINQTVASSLLLVAGEFNGDGKTDLVTDGNLLLGTTMSLKLVGGTPQSTRVGTPFPSPLQVVLRDSGNPVSGAVVTFCQNEGIMSGFFCFEYQPTAPDAVLSSRTALTDGSGIAQVTATANLVPGSYVIGAIYGGFMVPFSLTNSALPARLTATGGTPQFAVVGATFPNCPPSHGERLGRQSGERHHRDLHRARQRGQRDVIERHGGDQCLRGGQRDGHGQQHYGQLHRNGHAGLL